MNERASEHQTGEEFAVPRYRVSSSDIAGPNKLATLRELYGRELMRVDLISADPEGRPSFDATVSSFGGGVAFARCRATAMNLARTPRLMNDGVDDLLLSTTAEGFTVQVDGRDVVVGPGDGVLMSHARAYRVSNHRSGVTAGIQMPRARLAMLLPRLGEAPFFALPPGTPGLDLVFGYARLIADSAGMTPALLEKATAHLLELIASLVDPAREADPQAAGAARLDAFRRDIRANIARPGLSLERFAQLHGVTPRTVQRLFEREGDSFSGFVRRERLERARRILADPHQPRKRVLDIALECGFSDITTFNRAFRRAFGHTPSELRRRRDG